MEETAEEKSYNKLASRRFWIVVWAMAVITGIIVGSYIRNNYEMTGIAMALVAVVTAYVGIETYNKKYRLEHQEET